MKNKDMHNKLLYMAYKLFFGTLTSQPRLKIINLLRNKSLYVSAICKKLKMEQTAVSHNLKRLERCGFVHKQRKGKFMLYSINRKTISHLMEIIDKHMEQYCKRIINNKNNP